MPLLSHQLFSFSVSGVICHYYHTICTIKSLGLQNTLVHSQFRCHGALHLEVRCRIHKHSPSPSRIHGVSHNSSRIRQQPQLSSTCALFPSLTLSGAVPTHQRHTPCSRSKQAKSIFGMEYANSFDLSEPFDWDSFISFPPEDDDLGRVVG